jgi:hypothetical protein
MIEIRITIDTAMSLILERMKFELRLRQKQNFINPGLKLDELNSTELINLVEASIFDTIFLLPVDLINMETNLIQIIYGTVRALAKTLNREELLLYTNKKAHLLIQPICELVDKSLKDQSFQYN